MDNKSEDTIEGSARILEKELGIQEGFLEALKNEDDWSFIIKAHSLLEAAISHLIAKVTGLEKAIDVFSRLEISNNKTGKIAFMKSLEILGERDRGFIRFFSELRNDLIHDIKNVNISIKSYVGKYPKDQKKKIAENINFLGKDETILYNGKGETVETLLNDDPKYLIWYLSLYMIAIIYATKEIALIKRQAIYNKISMVDEFMKKKV